MSTVSQVLMVCDRCGTCRHFTPVEHYEEALWRTVTVSELAVAATAVGGTHLCPSCAFDLNVWLGHD